MMKKAGAPPWEIIEEDGQFWIRHKRYKTCRYNKGPFLTIEEAQTAMTKRREHDKLYGQFRSADIRERGKENELLKEMGMFDHEDKEWR